jgi:hypothetical protein
MLLLASLDPEYPLPLAATYRTYRFGERDVITVPASTRTGRLAGVAAFPAATPRALAFQAGLQALVRVGLDRWVATDQDEPVSAPVGLDGAGFVRAMGHQLGRDDLWPVVIYPRQAERRRLYIHLLAEEGERIAFAKLARGPENDDLLTNGGKALQAMARSNIRTFRYPSLLATGVFGDFRYLLLAPLPAGSRPLPPRWNATAERVRAEIGGRPYQAPRLDAATWWGRFERHAAVAVGLREVLMPEQERPFDACAAHGDFVNWNIYRHQTDWWVFDWEGYATDAPVLSDEVRFFLGIHTRAISVDPRWAGRLLLQRFQAGDVQRYADLSRALAFLCANEVGAALALGAMWLEIRPR